MVQFCFGLCCSFNLFWFNFSFILKNCSITHTLFCFEITLLSWWLLKFDLTPWLELSQTTIPVMTARWSFLSLILLPFADWLYKPQNRSFFVDLQVLTKTDKIMENTDLDYLLMLSSVSAVSIPGILVVQVSPGKMRLKYLGLEESFPWEEYC